MKSPVYGSPRGRLTPKRNYHHAAGGVKMNGKKTKRMGCGCCTCFDFREGMIRVIHKREMESYDS